ncbi:MAG: carboxypeptidase-like regulatory domain-containing protein [Dehalococcoidia bacterium]
MPTSRLSFAFALLAALAIACNGGSYSGSNDDSGIEGTVTIGPMCPVVSQDRPCPDEPYEATIVIEDESGDEVTTAESGQDGRFRVSLAPGTYTLAPQSPDAGALPFASEQQVEVAEGAYTEVSIPYDSGIR